MKTRKNILLAFAVIVISGSSSVYAATIEVGSGKPYTTIQSAITAATTGDTILVYDGTYKETIIVGKKLIVKSVNGSGSTTIDATGHGSMTSAVAFSSGLGRDTELDGFTIAHGVNFQGGNINCYNSSPTISNCFVYGGGSVYGAGIYCAGVASPLIANCVISGNLCAYGGGIYCKSSASPTIMNCTISQNRTDNDGSITNASGAGIFCDSASATVINTIIWGNTANGVPNTIHLKSGSSVSVSYSDIEGGWTGTGNIGSDPQFVMQGYWSNNGTAYIGDDYWVPGDFHLQAISPCIDNGTSSGAPSIDIEGTPRHQGAGFDMGAYEYAEPTTTTTVVTTSTTTTAPPTTTISSTTTVPPTVVNLINFNAISGNRIVTLVWSTASELDNSGFNLYRADLEDGEYNKINDSLIPSQGSSTQGANYEFIDTAVQNRKTYYYKLEDIDLNGNSSTHGPVSATPRWLYGFVK